MHIDLELTVVSFCDHPDTLHAVSVLGFVQFGGQRQAILEFRDLKTIVFNFYVINLMGK